MDRRAPVPRRDLGSTADAVVARVSPRYGPVVHPLRAVRSVLILATLLVPLGVGSLTARQSGRLGALADHGVRVEARVVAVADGGTFYAYTVDGTVHEWNVRRSEAPFGVGEKFPVLVSPELPSFSQPTVDRLALAQRAGDTRRIGAIVAAVALLFGLGTIGLLQRDIRRADQGRAPEPVTPSAYRRRLLVAGVALSVPGAGIVAWHARDAARLGQSTAPVVVAALLVVTLVGGMLAMAYRDGPDAPRFTRVVPVLATVGAALAAIRWLVLAFAG